MTLARKIAFLSVVCLLFILPLSAQQKMTNYTTRWNKIDSLISKKGLIQSALQEVNNIYTLAKKEKQDAEVIKALLYKSSLEQQTDESGTKFLAQWNKEISTSTEPVTSVLQSLLAQQYQSYFQQHRYQLYSRTATIQFNKEDIATWGVDDFQRKMSELYLASLKDGKLLQQTPLNLFDPIILKGNTRSLRPTLFDLLANRALDYFKNDERTITSPNVSFDVNDPNFFLPADAFSQLIIVSKDVESLYYRAVLTYQQLLSFHLADQNPDALIDADIHRLQFMYEHATLENKDQLFESALSAIATRYPARPSAAQASYLLAQLYANKAGSYEPLKNDADSNDVRYGYVKAVSICKQVLQQKDESEGKTNCFNLLHQIERRSLTLNTENVNLPQQPFRTLVTYRNISNIYLRMIVATDDILKKLQNHYDNNYWKNLAALAPLRSWTQTVPVTNGYQQHRTEIKVDALPVGRYILLSSSAADFSEVNQSLAVQYFNVSGISYINNNNEYFVLNRESGQPLAGAVLQTWWTAYDYTSRSNQKVKGEQKIADKNGYLRLNRKQDGRQGNLQIEISHEKDHLMLDDQRYVYFNQPDTVAGVSSAAAFEKENAHLFFFTDRSIYRPGQTIYFKGIAITKDFSSRLHKVYSGMAATVLLRNANGEEIDSIKLQTNAYGSYSGHFVLPAGLLNGEFTLVDEELDGSTSFSVEEYKRPKFLVDYEKIQGTYRVNDSVTITGTARGYAGNNIDGAKVKYRVQRVARFIYPWLYWKRGGYPNVKNAEIANGVAVTNADGKFTIQFAAIPDASISKTLEPVFDYRVSADVTDINGETRSAEVVVAVSYKALQLNVSVPPLLAIDSLKNISIKTQNLQGGFEPAQVNVFLYGLKAPDRLIRERLWPQPDQFSMSRHDFELAFPNDEYENESDPKNWPKDKVYLRAIDSTHSDGSFALPASKLPEGWYALEVSTRDKNGEEVKDVQYLQLYDESGKNSINTGYASALQQNNTIQPGEQTTITVRSAAPAVFLIQQIDKTKSDDIKGQTKPDSSSYHFIHLDGKEKFTFKATEADRGGFGVYHFFVKNNRFYHLTNEVSIPWTNKELQVAYESFRDKTLPGSEEKWKLKISGYKNEKLAAEMLASMYDASLDQFRPHSWTVPGIWSYHVDDMNWTGSASFSAVQSQERYYNEPAKYFSKSYDQLLTVGTPGRGQRIYKAGGAVPEMDMAAPATALAGVVPGVAVARKKAGSTEAEKSKADNDERMQPYDSAVTQAPSPAADLTQIRKNFNETSFFFPDLQTDSAGSISFGFTLPDALTQ